MPPGGVRAKRCEDKDPSQLEGQGPGTDVEALPRPHPAGDDAEPKLLPAATTALDAAPFPHRLPPPPARTSVVLLEAEPVLSPLVDATPVPVELPPGPAPDRSDGRRRLTRRRTAFVLLAAVAVFLVAAIAAGVAVGMSSRPASPSPPTTESESWSPGLESSCPTEISAWKGCLQDSGLDPQGCFDCYGPYYERVDVNEMPCANLTALICQGIAACSGSRCGDCGPSIEAYEACHRGVVCDLKCDSSSSPPAPSPAAPSSPTRTPTPSPAPVLVPTASAGSLGECEPEAFALTSCASATGDARSCLVCLKSLTANTTLVTCDDLRSFACGFAEACPDCGTCQDELAALSVCQQTSGCEAFECPSPPAAPPPASSPADRTPAPTYACPSEIAGFSECVRASNLDYEACVGCHDQYWDLVTDDTTCDEATALICQQIDSCAGSSCGTCGPYLETYERCNWGPECFGSCADSSPSSQPAAS